MCKVAEAHKIHKQYVRASVPVVSEVRLSDGLTVRQAGEEEKAKRRRIAAGTVVLRYSVGQLMRKF